MSITYFLMLLFVWWTLAEIRYIGMKFFHPSLSKSAMLECALYATLGAFFFHNVW